MTRIALVTGGTRGLGRAISIALKESGYNVAATYHANDERAKKLTDETGIHVFKFDVADFEACKNGVKEVEDDLGPVDILINNAGITRDAMMHKMDEEQWHKVIETNLTSCFSMSHAVLPHMRERGFGRIINISSINALAGQMGQTNYSAAKSGMIGFTKSLARESAAKGITVNCVAPGYAKTDMVEKVPDKVLEKIVAQIPMGRLGEPEDIARAVLFLAADDADFITGETLNVNGGHYMA